MYTKTILMKHQQDAINKLVGIRVGGLFMDMGTGKTRTAIELIVHREHRISKVIYFCPVTLKETVYQEFLKHTNLRYRNICVFDNETSIKNIPGVFVYIVGIESMSSSKRVVLTVNHIVDKNAFIIVDESSYIKTHYAWRTERILHIAQACKYRLLLTGTPITNNVQDLYSQMYFLSQKILGYNSFYSFAANHLEYSENYPDVVVRAHRTDWLSKKIAPYIYQVKKEECLSLPDKVYKRLYFRMTREQRVWYDWTKTDLLNLECFDSYTLFQLFSALQQIVSGFSNKYELQFSENPRLDLLKDFVKSVDSKAVIWCKYKTSLNSIAVVLFGKCAIIHGGQTDKDRQKQLRSFRNDKQFLVSMLGVGSHGLNLTQADTVVFYENGFNYAQRIQAEDRCHRIGQTKNVLYVDLICSDSIDTRISESIDRKENLIESFKREVEKVKKL
jgi:SNF2 family DNA or RNA helicase